MRHNKWFVGLSATAALIFATTASAQVFTYQGFLCQNGVPVNGTVSMTFRIYTAQTGGTLLGTVEPANVSVNNGLFTRELEFPSSVWNGDPRWLEIQIDSQVLTPRVRVAHAPYAIAASSALGLQGRSVAIAAPTTGQVLKWNGSAWSPANDLQDTFWQASGSNIFYTAGRVGIGVNNPAVALDVRTGTGSDVMFIEHTGTGRGMTIVARSDTAIWGNTVSGFAGIDGRSFSTRGVYGWANAPSGPTIGVEGVSDSTEGRGVQGLSRATTGNAYGGFFATESATGVGVYAVARTNSPSGFGGLFLGRVQIESVSDGVNANLRLLQTNTDHARLEFANQNAARRWQIAARIGATLAEDRLNLWNVQTGDILSLTGDGKVGVRTINPVVDFEVNGTARVKTLEILGADLAEKFPVSEPVEPGVVVEIDPQKPGYLRPARGAYNKRVAGVVAGANGRLDWTARRSA